MNAGSWPVSAVRFARPTGNEPENPYWDGDLTFEDPEGWRVVLRYVDS